MEAYQTKDGVDVYVHPQASHPHRLDLLAETISKIEAGDKPFIKDTVSLGRIIGKDHYVETTDKDTVVMYQRGNRPGESRMVVGREADDTDKVSIIVAKCGPEDGKEWDGKLVVVTLFEGELAPREPFDARATDVEKKAWETHALVPTGDERADMISKGLIKPSLDALIKGAIDKKEKTVGDTQEKTLHQALTYFDHLKEVLNDIADPRERNVTETFVNLVEDSAIEHFAQSVFGGKTLDALNFSIRHIYESSPRLEESDSPFSQMLNALVMLGDMGLPKGKITHPEARRYFMEIAPEFCKAVENPDPAARIDIARKWAVLTRPLWHKEAEKDTQNFDQDPKPKDNVGESR